MVGLTTAYYKIKEMEKPWRVVQGGQGASKNWSIEQILLEMAGEKKRIITIMTDTYENLKDGAIQDYQEMFHANGLVWGDFYNEGKKDLTWGVSTIQFRYIAGHKEQGGKSKRRNILYINETNKISYAAALPYIGRTKEVCFFDLNPDYETWVHTEIEPDKRAEKIILTYKDNEFCPQAEVDFIEGRKDNVEWYKVYGLGLTGTYSDRRIYQFKIIDALPEGIKRIPSGMDFGVSPDPTCLVDAFIDGPNLYWDELFEENGLMPTAIPGAERMCISDKLDELGFSKDWEIACDSSGASEIRDLRIHGYEAKKVEKPSGSQIAGIKKIKAYNIYVTKRSKHLIKALESWFWKTDHNGKIIAEPKGHEPDTLAAGRYSMMYYSKPRPTGKFKGSKLM